MTNYNAQRRGQAKRLSSSQMGSAMMNRQSKIMVKKVNISHQTTDDDDDNNRVVRGEKHTVHVVSTL